MIYQAITQQGAKYGLAGRYGVILSTMENDYDHIVYFEWKLYNGMAGRDGNLYLMYAQFEDPENEGTYESVTCTVRYFRDKAFADVTKDVVVKNYYGKNMFENSGAGVEGRPMTQLNQEDLLTEKIWVADLSNPERSYSSKYSTSQKTAS